MNITIDTDKKEITMHENVNIKELLTFLRSSIVGWESYTLVTLANINISPITPSPTLEFPYIPNQPVYPPQDYPVQPFWGTSIYSDGITTTHNNDTKISQIK